MNIPETLIAQIGSSDHLTILTGAGVSAESGIPTFRDAMTGLWSKYKAEELATPQAFQRDPALVWSWYQWRKKMVETKEPNAGHYALAELGLIVSQLTLITQNVDGFHQQAGSNSVIELHGNIRRSICFDNRHTQPADIALTAAVEEIPGFGEVGVHQPPPECGKCGSLLRPDVIWFGESLNPDFLNAAADAAMNCDLFFSIGTSSLVYPAAGLADIARRAGATIVEINPNPTPLTPDVDFAIHGAGGNVLPALVQRLRQFKGTDG